MIPSSPQTCAAHNQAVTCNFELYGSNNPLLDFQKLAPNEDITGQKIVKVFIINAFIAIVLSLALSVDKVKVNEYDSRPKRKDKEEHKRYVKLIHTIETLLQTLSDQQLIASIALLLAVNQQACELSAYHYNLVCTMLVLGVVTHLNLLMNITDFLNKGKFVALYRLVGILAQVVLSGFVLKARMSNNFPTTAGPLSIIPAACFENMNSTDILGVSSWSTLAHNVTTAGVASNTTANANQIMDNLTASTTASGGIGEYTTLAAFLIIALASVTSEYLQQKLNLTERKRIGMSRASIAFSFMSIIASTVIVVLSFTRYNRLRSEMDIPALYRAAEEKQWTFSQILPILMMAGSSIAVVKAVTESFIGIPGKRFENQAANALKRGGKTLEKNNGYEDVEKRDEDGTSSE
ncbi:hypothetical protein HYFRA_00001405 [Hymenoscyphus fraxineus]|uniref:Uncharacterized protein n=1 Tax=Hymenoscyphus fraxineus TaxID=746836 RepID=A0A9N9L6M6_9HELO|nr:hypothetical protein HYFRA_00001405 [Hymenoscyphus fraxineus]